MNRPRGFILTMVLLVGSALLSAGIAGCNQHNPSSQVTDKTEKPQAQASKDPLSDDQESLVQTAVNNYSRRVQEAAELQSANARLLQQAQAMEMRGVDQRAKLENKRSVARNFIASNREWQHLLEDQEVIWREELTRLGVPSADLEADLKRIKDPVPERERLLGVARLDQEIGENMLGALNYLDEHWGSWNLNPDHGQLQISQAGSLEEFNSFAERIDAATRRRQALTEAEPKRQ